MNARPMLCLLALMCCAPVLRAGNAPATKPVELFPVVQNGKWGYIDKTGKIAIKPQWDYAWDFREGLARVLVGDLRGYIDPTGKMVVEPKYFLAWDFHEGLAAVMVPTGRFGGNVNTGKWCYIDKTGRRVIKPLGPAKWAEDFHEGKARYKSHGSGISPSIYIDRRGRQTSGFLRTPIRDFHEGLAAGVVRRRGWFWGFRDHSYKFVIPPRFAAALDFAEGLAPVGVKETVTQKDQRGRIRKTSRIRWGFIDKTGKIIIPARFEQARSFSEGLASVQVGGKWGCIDKTGKVVIQPRYEFVAPFSEGLARVVLGGKHGYIDKTGKVVVPPKFDVGWEFSKGLARVEIDGKIGYIDRTGATVWKPTK